MFAAPARAGPAGPEPVALVSPGRAVMEQLADTLSTQLENLRRECERLERLLMLDANWRALQQLEAREAAGEPLVAVDAVGLKASLERALAANRIYVARARLTESIELLSGAPAPEPVPLANRIVMLAAPTSEGFRTRLRMKQMPSGVQASPSIEGGGDAPPAHAAIEVEAHRADAATMDGVPKPLRFVKGERPPTSSMRSPTDALELIDGLDRSSVEQLIEGDVSRYRHIADWKCADVERWRDRLGVDKCDIGAWIEQAAVLAEGRRTSYAQKARRGDFAALVPQPDPLLPPIPVRHPEPQAAMVSNAVPVEPTPAIEALVAPEFIAAANDVNFQFAAGIEDLAKPDDVTVDGSVSPLPVYAGSVGPADSDRFLSADELIRTLASVSPPVEPPAALPAIEPRGPYVRPELRRDIRLDRRGVARREDDVAAEVIVVRRDPQPATLGLGPGPGYAQAERPRPQRLLRRLKQALEPDRFEADGYAAYRSVAEEAVVTILRAEPQPAHPIPRVPTPERSGTGYNRFLKALTGQR